MVITIQKPYKERLMAAFNVSETSSPATLVLIYKYNEKNDRQKRAGQFRYVIIVIRKGFCQKSRFRYLVSDLVWWLHFPHTISRRTGPKSSISRDYVAMLET